MMIQPLTLFWGDNLYGIFSNYTKFGSFLGHSSELQSKNRFPICFPVLKSERLKDDWVVKNEVKFHTFYPVIIREIWSKCRSRDFSFNLWYILARGRGWRVERFNPFSASFVCGGRLSGLILRVRWIELYMFGEDVSSWCSICFSFSKCCSVSKPGPFWVKIEAR